MSTKQRQSKKRSGRQKRQQNPGVIRTYFLGIRLGFASGCFRVLLRFCEGLVRVIVGVSLELGMRDSECFRFGAQLVLGWLWFKAYLQLNVEDVDASCLASKMHQVYKLISTFAVSMLSPFGTSCSSAANWI